MAVRLSQPTSRGLLAIGFNQDASCVISSGLKGICIYSIDNATTCAKLDNIGSVSLASMLYCTSLLAFCGAGEQPAYSPRRLTMYNTHNNSVISTLLFPTSVLGILLNRKFMCVILESAAQIYSLESVRQACIIPTDSNPKGLAALSIGSDPCYLALPANKVTDNEMKGRLAIHTITSSQDGNSVLEIDAHRTQLAAMSWNADASMLATASVKGTVIRVFKMPQGLKLFSLRRGTSPARITSMSFSQSGPPLLFVASDHGSVHVYSLQHGVPQNPAAAVAKNLLSRFLHKQPTPVGHRMLTFHVHCKKGSLLAVGVPKSRSTAQGGQSSVAGRVAVATTEGILYVYSVEGLEGKEEAKAILEGEWLWT